MHDLMLITLKWIFKNLSRHSCPPQNARELFNLRHSSLRVTVERAFGALKNRFKILYNKPFHPYPTQVKLVLACCILHNWIIWHGYDEHVPDEATWEPNPSNEVIPNDQMMDSTTWAAKRDDWANQMRLIGGHAGTELLLFCFKFACC